MKKKSKEPKSKGLKPGLELDFQTIVMYLLAEEKQGNLSGAKSKTAFENCQRSKDQKLWRSRIMPLRKKERASRINT